MTGVQTCALPISWLNVSGINASVPPYTMGWAITVQPTQWNVSVRFVDSPSGTPSDNVGNPVTVRLSATPLPNNPGFASGASEYQTAGRGANTYRFDSFELNESLSIAAVTITPATNTRLVLLGWRMFANLAFSEQTIRTPVSVHIIDGMGAALFPNAVITPESPDSGYMAPVGRELGLNGTVELGGIVAIGGGRVAVTSFLEFYVQREQ